MDKKKQTVFYGILLCLGVAAFLLEVLLPQSPDGLAGALICAASLSLASVSAVMLTRVSRGFQALLEKLQECSCCKR